MFWIFEKIRKIQNQERFKKDIFFYPVLSQKVPLRYKISFRESWSVMSRIYYKMSLTSKGIY